MNVVPEEKPRIFASKLVCYYMHLCAFRWWEPQFAKIATFDLDVYKFDHQSVEIFSVRENLKWLVVKFVYIWKHEFVRCLTK